MDFVPNHSSNMHPYYRDLVANQKDSPYWDFYDHDSSGAVTHYFDWTNLPNHNYNNKDIWRYITEAFAYWVREFDVDGFRVDVAWGVKERCPEYWPEWRRELKRIKPDLLLLAEASARDPYYFDNGFDAAYDWTDELGHWAWENVWNTYKNNTLIPYLEMALLNGHTGFHPDALIFRFLNNNDTGKRFITNWGPEMTRVATGLLLTLPGLPCVYTGDEYGEEFHPYQASMPLKFLEKVPGLREYHKKLISLRKEVPSLHSRDWTVVEVNPGPKVYAYVRHLPDGSQPVLVLLNFFPEDLNVTVDLPEQFRSLGKAGKLRDLLADEDVPVQGSATLKLKLPSMRVMILS
jgi:glycosidase